MNSNITTSSPLLKLPNELRNKIYDFALMELHPIIHSLTPSDHSCFLQLPEESAQEPTKECNQLKYVSHQIRRETIGYELKVNGISFIQQKYDSPMAQFIFFINKCAPRYQNYIRTAYIR